MDMRAPWLFTHKEWLEIAERIDAFRIVPRLILVSYYGFFVHAWYYVVTWFMAFQWERIDGNADVTLAVAGFPAIILGVLTGVLNALTKSYFGTGRNWENAASADGSSAGGSTE